VQFSLTAEGFGQELSPGLESIREALVNMLMHTDYFSAACPRVRIFTNHIEFFNPGGLPKPFEELKNKDISLPRNPILAKLFRMVKLAENAGFGFDKIEENWKAYNSTTPDYQIEFDSVVVDFKLEEESELGDKLGDNQLKILSEIEKDNTVSIASLSKIIGISTTAVENNISKLKIKGYLRRIGSAKSGYWELTK
jgi:predicted HTH transcriptional regulator